jgi:3-hydroxyisobutyrate dehydrogenase-like beta-hydroxyacid dehydrogenase
MSDITVVGLGLMGTALARAIQHVGHSMTVRNRSPQKMQPIKDEGVATAADLATAIAASPVILICIDNYAVTDAIIKSEKIIPLLAGRTVVQLSSGTPLEALEASEWMKMNEVCYLDGAILGGPTNIGTESGHILLSGDEEAYRQAQKLLDCLGGKVRYLGTNPRAATVLDLAWLCERYGQFLATTHAAILCESEDVSVGDFASLFDTNSPTYSHASTIHSGDFENCTATLQVWRAALQHIQTQGMDAGINTDFPDYVDSLFEKAVEAGYGNEHVMSLVKVLR